MARAGRAVLVTLRCGGDGAPGVNASKPIALSHARRTERLFKKDGRRCGLCLPALRPRRQLPGRI